MSLEAITWAMNEAPVEDSAGAAVLQALANHADPAGRNAFPAVDRIAYYTRLSERTVRRHLDKLEAEGLILKQSDTRMRDAVTRPDQRPQTYALQMHLRRESYEQRRDRLRADRDGVSESHPVDGERGVTVSERGATLTERGVTDDTTGCHGDTRTVLEPSLEQPSPDGDGAHTRETPKPSRAKPRTRIPDEWEPSEPLAAWTREKAPGIPRSELDQFRDHHTARGSLMADWDAAWRTWVGNWTRFGARGRAQPGRRGPYRNTGYQDGTTDASWDAWRRGPQ